MRRIILGLLGLGCILCMPELCHGQGTWLKMLGPPHGEINRTQVNTKIASDRKWRIAVIGYQTNINPFPGEIISTQDSMTLVQGDWNSQAAAYRSDSLSAINIDKPLNSRIPNLVNPRILVAGFFPIGASMTNTSPGTSGGQNIPAPPVGISDISTEDKSDSTWVCIGVDRVLRFREFQFTGAWTTLYTAPTGTRFYAVAAKGSNIFAAGLRGRLYRSQDRGRTFASSSTGIPSTASIWDLSFPTADTGYAATSEGIYATYDAGTTWQQKVASAATVVSFYSAREGFALLDLGVNPVYLTQNSGQGWQPQSPISSQFTGGQGKIVSLSATREGHCYVLMQRPQSERYDSIYYFRNDRPRIVAVQEELTETRSILTVYPNPAKEKLLIEGLQGEQKVWLVSATGQRVLEFTAQQGKNEMPLKGIRPGLYLLLVRDGEASVSRRVVVE